MKRALFLLVPLQIFLVNCNIDNTSVNDEKEAKIDTLEVVNWITENAVLIEEVEPLSTVKELEVLYPILETKRVVALGDGTHGTSDFFKLKHKIINQLVNDLDYSAVVMELPFDIGVHINNYIKTGEGNIDELIEQTWWWHRSEEIKSFFIWMHDFNKDLPNSKKVSFYGFDCQVHGDNTFQIFQYLKKVDTDYNKTIQPILDFVGELYINNYEEFTPYRIDKWDNVIEELNELLKINKNKYINSSSREEFLITKARVNTLKGNIQMQKTGGGVFPSSKVRSEINARNIEIISELEGANSKIVLWAHNGHIRTDKYLMQEFFNLSATEGFYDSNWLSKESIMGYLLKEKFKDSYFNIGFEFFNGSFTAIDFGKGFNTFTIDNPEENTLPFLLNRAEVESNQYFLLLEQANMNKSAKEYFSSIQISHEIGAAYISRYIKLIPCASYDGIIFLKQTTGAKLLE